MPCPRDGCSDVLKNLRMLTTHLHIHNVSDGCASLINSAGFAHAHLDPLSIVTCPDCGEDYQDEIRFGLHSCKPKKKSIKGMSVDLNRKQNRSYPKIRDHWTRLTQLLLCLGVAHPIGRAHPHIAYRHNGGGQFPIPHHLLSITSIIIYPSPLQSSSCAHPPVIHLLHRWPKKINIFINHNLLSASSLQIRPQK